MRIIAGVDPGRATGVAVYYPEDKVLIHCATLDWWDAIDYIVGQLRAAEVILVEDPSQNAPVFARGLTGGPLSRLSQNVGANKQMASLMIERLKREGMNVVPVRPKKEKWDAATFAEHFKYHGRTSQHARDAARLIHGYIADTKQPHE